MMDDDLEKQELNGGDHDNDDHHHHNNDKENTRLNDDNEGGVDIVRTHSINTSLRSSIRKCIKIVSKKPEKTLSSGNEFTGYLNVKKRNLDWKRRWIVLNTGNGHVQFYKNESRKKETRKGKVVYIFVKKIKDVDGLAAKQIEEGKPVCTQHIVFFTKSKSHVLAADSDSDMNEWKKAAIETLKNLFPDNELKEKRQAAKALFPLIEEQVYIEWRKYEYLRKVLSDTFLVSHLMPTAVLSGYLSLKTKHGEWKKLYCALHKKYFQYYNLKDKKLPIGVIALKYICELPEDKKNETDFKIITPVCSYSFRSKHIASRRAWIQAISDEKAKKKNGGTKIEVEGSLINAAPISGTLVLRYGKNGKTNKSYTLKPGVNTIGRSTGNSLKVPDSRISRNHCKIVLDDGKGPVYYDLGSMGGSVINDKPTESKALCVGDTIRIGETTIILESN